MMSVEETQGEIDTTERNIEQLKAEMESAAQEFRRVVATIAPGWMTEEARSSVARNHAKSQALGEAGIAELRKKIEEEVAQVPAYVEQCLGRAELWAHRRPLPTKPLTTDATWEYGFGANVSLREAKGLEAGFRRVISHIAQPLLDAGMITTKVRENTSPWGIGDGDPRVRYAGYLSTIKEIDAATLSYSALFERFCKLAQRLIDLRERKEQEKAAALWDRK